VVSPRDTRETGSLHGCAWRDTYLRNILEAEDIWLVETCKKNQKKKKNLLQLAEQFVELKVPCAHMENFSQVVMKVSFNCDY
jgi:hypothetical protein